MRLPMKRIEIILARYLGRTILSLDEWCGINQITSGECAGLGVDLNKKPLEALVLLSELWDQKDSDKSPGNPSTHVVKLLKHGTRGINEAVEGWNYSIVKDPPRVPLLSLSLPGTEANLDGGKVLEYGILDESLPIQSTLIKISEALPGFEHQ